MVINTSRLALHPIEQTLCEFLTLGKTPHVDDLGGLTMIVQAIPEISGSKMATELLTVLMQYQSNLAIDDQAVWKNAISDLIQGVNEDITLIEIVDAIDENQQLSQDVVDDVFNIFLQKAENSSLRITGYARSLALEGAFRIAIPNRRRQLRFLHLLLGIKNNDDPEFLRNAAKILGIAYSHWREPELICILRTLLKCDEAAYDASFELAMAAVAAALDESKREVAGAHFNEALSWFKKAIAMRESTPEASLYVECLALLADFETYKTGTELRQRSFAIQKSSFELFAWHINERNPPWLGARHVEAMCWINLAHTLIELSDSLDEISWWEPKVVIECQVLAAYCAGRTILRRNVDGYLEDLLRPRIVSSIANREGQLYILKRWLKENSTHGQVREADALLDNIEQFMLHNTADPPNPIEAAFIGAPVAAALQQAQCTDDTKRMVLEVLSHAFQSSTENLSIAEINILEQCLQVVKTHPDYCSNIRGAKLFHTVLLWTVRFLKNRLEITKKDDPSVRYLFEQEGTSLPHEDELQADYFRWLCAQSGGSEIEVNNVGSGRADVAMKTTGERVVIEVKRELKDASFDSLEISYAGQTVDYQNVSIRLGFLLILDLTQTRLQGTPHISSLIECRSITREGESVPRQVVIVKVPGRRLVPSEVKLIRS